MTGLIPGMPWPVGWSIAVFALAAAVTVAGGIRLVRLGDALADRTGWGEALFGAVFFGAATSLSGIVMTAVAAGTGQPQLGYSNAVGGIIAQTAALAVADAFHRRANLEHATASHSNLLFGCLLAALLSLALLGSFTPAVTLAAVHPISVAMVACYLGGLWLIRSADDSPMWRAVRTDDTRPDTPQQHGKLERHSTSGLWAHFIPVAAVVAVGGWAVTLAAESLVEVTGLAAGFVGTVFMGVVNALPEAVTAIAAVRHGAPTLAVAAVIGGNSLDALNLVVGDIAYRGGSLFHTAESGQLFTTAAALFMTTIVLGGLLIRQSHGWGRLGFEGILLPATWLAAVAVLAF